MVLADPVWLRKARSYLGQREIKGPKHNPLIPGWFRKMGAGWFIDDETAWCGAFVGGVLAECALPVPAKGAGASARAWASYGLKLDRAAVGCIVVFSREGGGHVGFVVGQDQRGNLMVLGGNQGDMVKISPFNYGRVIAYRWPGSSPLAERFELPLIGSDGRLSTNEA